MSSKSADSSISIDTAFALSGWALSSEANWPTVTLTSAISVATLFQKMLLRRIVRAPQCRKGGVLFIEFRLQRVELFVHRRDPTVRLRLRASDGSYRCEHSLDDVALIECLVVLCPDQHAPTARPGHCD